MCIGCGACHYICPDNKISLLNVIDEGIRPILTDTNCNSCTLCLDTCPGYETIQPRSKDQQENIPELQKSWGSVLEVWEGFATDNEIHHDGSSAGMATALALYCVEKENFYGTLHIGSDENYPLENKTYLSRSRDELLIHTGSRYAPASPCDSLDKIENAPNPCVFIGKPCDVSGMRKAENLKEKLSDKIGLSIGIFCAGAPSTKGTVDLLNMHEIPIDEIQHIRYRGKGWPGHFSVDDGNTDNLLKLTYKESWGFLQKYRPYRCHMCPEGTSESADLSCGDPWYRGLPDNETGSSLVLVRTEKGKEILKKAHKAGYINVQPLDPEKLGLSQVGLWAKRQAIWGRLLAFRIFNIPVPKFKGFELYDNWRDLSLKEKLRSVLATIKRILLRKYYRPNKMLR
jgi:coenzyme F420 hydrogenase subunit beta